MKKLDLEELLFKVEKPARYIGNEINAVKKDLKDVNVRVGFTFPDVYEVGMSHVGMHILYYVLNKQKDIYCERIFAPWTDMEACLREKNMDMFTLETHSPIKDMDFVAVTLQYELSYSNILNILNLGKIPIKSEDRKEEDPFVFAGGPCAYNPEPLADIVDIFVLGEGEEVLLEMMDSYKKWKGTGKTKKDFLESIAHIGGVYIPSFYDVKYNDDHTIKEFEPKKEAYPKVITKRIIENMDEVEYPDKVVVPFIDIVHNRAIVEIFRGCIRGCRFCQAGMIYRPMRQKSAKTITESAKKIIEATGYEELSLSSLSTSDHCEIEGIVRGLMDEYGDKKVGLSLPSLRLDAFPIEIIEQIQKVRKTGLTFAPEAGTQRLRDVINKGITEEDLIGVVKNAFELGWTTIKLYFMIGLPTETYEDLDGIADLAGKVIDAYYSIPREKREKGLNVTVSVSSFVPKAFTPFQWHPQDTIEQFREKQSYLKEKLRNKNIKYSYHDNKTSFLEAVFARGDRRTTDVLIKAWEKGCKFDGWGQFFEYDKWMEAFDECNIDPHFYVNRKREYDEVFPWDFINVGVTKKFLEREDRKARDEELTLNCRVKCAGCGINQGLIGGECECLK
ncbi:TIGR03960 family B12-binding radical SAM protein [Lutibacter sp. B2]|nr:TIGR03960 family B12-binding radical SAM protein [Lutibacter sp. B2]